MISADQVVAHLIGDYLLQSDWMAQKKTSSPVAAAVHACTYAFAFVVYYVFVWLAWWVAVEVFERPVSFEMYSLSIEALVFIAVTHFVIDHWQLARYVVWAKNFLAPRQTTDLVQVPNSPAAAGPDGYVNQHVVTSWWYKWEDCVGTGYHKDRPAWLAVWLLIIGDNTLHLLCNGLAFYWFG